jgi:hypothetical protein
LASAVLRATRSTRRLRYSIRGAFRVAAFARPLHIRLNRVSDLSTRNIYIFAPSPVRLAFFKFSEGQRNRSGGEVGGGEREREDNGDYDRRIVASGKTKIKAAAFTHKSQRGTLQTHLDKLKTDGYTNDSHRLLDSNNPPPPLHRSLLHLLESYLPSVLRNGPAHKPLSPSLLLLLAGPLRPTPGKSLPQADAW